MPIYNLIDVNVKNVMNANPSQSRERKPAILKFVLASFIIKCGIGMTGKQYLFFLEFIVVSDNIVSVVINMRPFNILILFFFIACRSNTINSDNITFGSALQKVLVDTPATTLAHDTLRTSRPTPYIWLVDFDKITKTKNPNFKKEYLNVDTLINGLNQTYPNIILDKIKISGDTLFTEIKDSEYLGERIGSYGAFAYIADVVINLTSVKNINFVKIDFEDGSHISHGTWGKNEFKNYKEVH